MLETVLLESTEPVIAMLKSRFLRLKWKEQHVETHDAAKSEDISFITSCIDFTNGDATSRKMTFGKRFDCEKSMP